MMCVEWLLSQRSFSSIDLGLDDEEHEVKRQKLSSDEKAAASMNDLNPLKVTKVEL